MLQTSYVQTVCCVGQGRRWGNALCSRYMIYTSRNNNSSSISSCRRRRGMTMIHDIAFIVFFFECANLSIDIESSWLGAKIACHAKIRLEHINTRRNLHSHNFASPLSHGRDFHEVSCFGVEGTGDSSDSWIVECEASQECRAEDKESCGEGGIAHWTRDGLVYLRHDATGRYLHTDHAARFDQSNCPRCPIVGQQEVNTVPTKNKNEQMLWFAGEGIYMGGH